MKMKNENMDILERLIYSDEQIKIKITNSNFAFALYGSLCNIIWSHEIHGKVIFTWREAGEIVGGDYMEYYCSGYEGIINLEVKEILAKYGWTPEKA